VTSCTYLQAYTIAISRRRVTLHERYWTTELDIMESLRAIFLVTDFEVYDDAMTALRSCFRGDDFSEQFRYDKTEIRQRSTCTFTHLQVSYVDFGGSGGVVPPPGAVPPIKIWINKKNLC
jgi:hypothetical protein